MPHVHLSILVFKSIIHLKTRREFRRSKLIRHQSKVKIKGNEKTIDLVKSLLRTIVPAQRAE